MADFMQATKKKPARVVQLVAAMSVDGRIANAQGDFSPFSSNKDQDFLQEKIEQSDVLMMGRKTYEKHVKQLKKPAIVFTRTNQGIQLADQEGPELHWFNDTRQELVELWDLLKYHTITVLGGSEVYHWCVENRIVTDAYFTIEPWIIGKGTALLEGAGLQSKASWNIRSLRKVNEQGSVMVHYSVT